MASGDPRKLAKAVMVLVNAKTSPTRLQLGNDAVARVEARNAHVARESASGVRLRCRRTGLKKRRDGGEGTGVESDPRYQSCDGANSQRSRAESP